MSYNKYFNGIGYESGSINNHCTVMNMDFKTTTGNVSLITNNKTSKRIIIRSYVSENKYRDDNNDNVYMNIGIGVLYDHVMEIIIEINKIPVGLFIQNGNGEWYDLSHDSKNIAVCDISNCFEDSLSNISIHIYSNWQSILILHVTDAINFVIEGGSDDSSNYIAINLYKSLPLADDWRTYVLNNAIKHSVILSDNCPFQFHCKNKMN